VKSFISVQSVAKKPPLHPIASRLQACGNAASSNPWLNPCKSSIPRKILSPGSFSPSVKSFLSVKSVVKKPPLHPISSRLQARGDAASSNPWSNLGKSSIPRKILSPGSFSPSVKSLISVKSVVKKPPLHPIASRLQARGDAASSNPWLNLGKSSIP
jgi:hypothetical protein